MSQQNYSAIRYNLRTRVSQPTASIGAEELAHSDEVEAQQAALDDDDEVLAQESDEREQADASFHQSCSQTSSHDSGCDRNSDASNEDDNTEPWKQASSPRSADGTYTKRSGDGNSDGSSELDPSLSQGSFYCEQRSDPVEDAEEEREKTPQPDDGPRTPPRRAQATRVDTRRSGLNRSRNVPADPAPSTPVRSQLGPLTPLGNYNRSGGGARTTPVTPKTAVDSPSSSVKQKTIKDAKEPLFLPSSSQENTSFQRSSP